MNTKAVPQIKLAIATTIADAADAIEEFIEYHTHIGFDKFYIFVDDNDEETINIIKKYDNVSYQTRNQELYNEWDSLTDYKNSAHEKWQLLNKEVMVRQELNFLIAAQKAKNEGIDWLLHIDLDELFYPNAHNPKQYFSNLQAQHYGGVTFLNYEAIYTKEKSKSIYRSSIFFKKNFFRFGHWVFNQEQRQLIKENEWIGEKYFKYYQNGKSCVSMHGKTIHIPDVHSIWTNGKRKFGKHDDPIILHFPCSSIDYFYKKYKRLGSFPDEWMGKKRAGDYIDEIHLIARDILAQPEKSESKNLYLKNFILNRNKIYLLINHNMAIKIKHHLEVLNAKKYQGKTK